MWRVGVVGCGSMGANHIRILKTMRDVDEVVAYDPDEQRLGEVSRRYGCIQSDLADLMASCSAIVIAAPTAHHAELLKRAEGYVAVLCEKPLYLNESDITGQEGDWPAVGYIERFNPAWDAFARVCCVEKPFHYAVERLSPWTARAQDTSVVTDLMSHDLACLLSLHGPPEGIRARGFSARSPALDCVTAMLEWRDGIVATLTASKASQHKVRRVVATCPGCVVEADLLRRSVSIHRQGSSIPYEYGGVTQEGSETHITVPPVEPLRAELEDFLEAARTKRPPRVTAASAAVVQLAAAAIEEQILTFW